jgi:hypothetical protein
MGIHHIAHLLARPGEYIPAVDLLMAVGRDGVPISRSSTNGTMTVPAGDAGPLLDGNAKNDYRRRVNELRVLFDDAERSNDAGRAAAVRMEMQFIEDQLAAAVGRWGRDRRAASAAERARLTVTKRIKGVLERIASRHPPLAEHLGRTIRTGLMCAYIPGSDRTTHWSL